MPGFDTSSWLARDLVAGLPDSNAGIGFFVTTFNLDIPKGYDVPVSFVFSEPLGQPYRAYLFVNGWMMGKRVGNLGFVHCSLWLLESIHSQQRRPQAKFPVHEGILDYRGEK